MRKQWFGDSRDYAKWNFVFGKSQGHDSVCYIAMSRPDELPEHIHPTVKAFFDEYKNLDLVRKMFSGRYTSVLSDYHVGTARAYFAEAVDRITELQTKGSVLIFIDPDTGIQPVKRPSSKHVLYSDLHRVCRALQKRDELIVYQHAPRMKRASWIDDCSIRLSNQPWFEPFDLETHYDPKCASDACFLVIQKRPDDLVSTPPDAAPPTPPTPAP